MIITETAKFIKEEAEVTTENAELFMSCLTESVKERIAKEMEVLKAAKARLMERKSALAKSMKEGATKKAETIRAEIKKLEEAIAKKTASLKRIPEEMTVAKNAVKGAIKSNPKTAAALAAGAAGAGAYAAYRKMKGDNE
jgi:hypothetical protein